MSRVEIRLFLCLSVWIGACFGSWQHSLDAGMWMASLCGYAMFLVWVQFEGE